MAREIQYMGGDQYRQNNQEEKRQTITDCNPTQLGDELMSEDGVFINKETIHKICKCTKKALCVEFLRTLDQSILETIIDKDGELF